MTVPAHHLRWNLYGAGLENLGRNGKPELLPTPQPAPNEVLARIDAVGICFSDLKILRLGEAHPKIARDLRQRPVVMGHEISCTIAQVGENLRDRFHVGERYIVQADVYVNGRVQAVGYALDGGYSQYTIFGEPVLNGDAGCYLLRCPEHLSYAEAALVEPWACIVASYRIQPRPTPQPNGKWLVILPHAPMVRYKCSALEPLRSTGVPARADATSSSTGVPARADALSSGTGVPARAEALSSGTGVPARAEALSSGTGVTARAEALSSGTGVTARAKADAQSSDEVVLERDAQATEGTTLERDAQATEGAALERDAPATEGAALERDAPATNEPMLERDAQATQGIALILVDARGNPLAEEFLNTAQQLGMATERIEVSEDALYDPALLQRLRETHAPDGFTDILIYGNPTPALLETAIDALTYGGALSFTCHHKTPPVPVDVGRLHYDRLMIMGTTGWDITDAYRYTRDTALRRGDRLLLFGAGGAMGQMQLFYALTRPEPPAQVVVVDRHPERLEPLRELGIPLAQSAGIDLQFYCNADAEPEVQQAHLRSLCPHGFDQIMLLASAPDAVTLTYPLLTDGGVLNLFAGIPKGQKVALDLTPLASRHMRLLGSSGSTMDDIAECLRLVAEGALPARKVIGAIAGLNALPEALRAVQEHRYPGKIVIFPQLPDLPLLGLQELATHLPAVYARLEDERYWTKAAEEALYRV